MFKQVTLTNKCLAIVMQRADQSTDQKSQHRSNSRASAPENGFRTFQEFQDENRASFWNPGLVQSVNALEFVGFVRPGTLFVSGNELHLECLRGAWARRVLKPPPGFTIKRLGDIGGIEMQEVPQTQFIPLPEVLCLIVSNLNRIGEPATLAKIINCLSDEYDGMCIPKQEVLYATLGALIAEGKLYCMGDHYFIPTPTMYQYYQQQFLRRNGPTPPSYLWTKEQEPAVMALPQRSNIQKSQETCSRECQTGASVACGQPPYVPPTKKDQATSAQSQNLIPTNEADGRRRPTQPKEKPSKENKGFLNRLFGRNKGKQTNGVQKPGTRPDGDLQCNKVANDRPSTSAPSQQPDCAINVPLATFSAQFPPPEWLCDPRFIKSATAKEPNQQQQPLLAKIRRTAKEQNQQLNPAMASARDQQRHSVWVDPIDGGGGQGKLSSNFSRRERSEQKRCFASQRHHENRNQYGHLSPNENYDRYNRSNKQRNRLSKYLSSSSECLRELPYQSKKSAVVEEKRRSSNRHYHDRLHQQQQHYSVYQFSQPHHNQLDEHHGHQRHEETPPTPKANVTDPGKIELDEHKIKSTLERPSRPNPSGTVVSRIPPLALPTDAEFDSVSECNGAQRTSTPTPVKRPVLLETEISDKTDQKLISDNPGQQLTTENTNGQRDSAYSVSPVVTEMSSSEGKYSSWSGSDAHREQGAATTATSPESADRETLSDANRLKHLDNTYVNDSKTRCRALDHTYENLDRDNGSDPVNVAADVTKYENVSTDFGEKPTAETTKEVNLKAAIITSSIHAYVSSI